VAHDYDAPVGKALAVTVLSYDESTGAIVDADIALAAWLLVGVGGAWLAARRRSRAVASLGVGVAILIGGASSARSAPGAASGALARVESVPTEQTEYGVLRTTVALSPLECHAASCPARAVLTVWGGRRAGIVQQVGDLAVPRAGDQVEVSFARP
jgi:hypothetical protein